MSRSGKGQILPLFALMVVALFAIAAIAIDVSNVYASRRAYRTWADEASLAGAQDLQIAGSRSVGADQYATALAHSKLSIENQLGDGSTCSPAIPAVPVSTTVPTRVNCTMDNLPYTYSIVTPLPSSASCATCDPQRSVQVNFADPKFSLTFSRILGFNEYSVAVTAVAGMDFSSAYTIVTLRPPSAATIPGVRSLRIDGGTRVVVNTGDVGTNANMTYSGTNSLLILDSGYRMDYYDPANPPLWGGNPPGHKIFSLIPDPGYPVPSKGSSPPVGSVDTTGCSAIADSVYANANYAPSVPVVAGPPIAPDMTKITCYKAGVYSSVVNVNNGTLAILEPGLYFFDGGLNAQGSVIGGYQPSSEGVALVFRESSGTMFKNRTSGGSSSLMQIVALNAGDRYLNGSGHEATAALDYSGNPVQTNTTPAVLMTVIVPPDPRCPVVVPFPAVTCTSTVENTNKAIDLSGGSGLYLAGVQYAPSDNVSVAGNTTTGGYVGQIWAWTIQYTGGSQINQEGLQAEGPGVLRLDAACTVPGTPCVP
jgi:Flp pilus assembly protein TadG